MKRSNHRRGKATNSQAARAKKGNLTPAVPPIDRLKMLYFLRRSAHICMLACLISLLLACLSMIFIGFLIVPFFMCFSLMMLGAFLAFGHLHVVLNTKEKKK